MDNTQLTLCEETHALDFNSWIPLIRLSLADLPDAGGNPYAGFAAVYAMRDVRTGDILKYGISKEFRGRIYGNYIGGTGGPGGTTERMHRALFGEQRMIEHVEIAWIVTKDEAEAKKLETKFR